MYLCILHCEVFENVNYLSRYADTKYRNKRNTIILKGHLFSVIFDFYGAGILGKTLLPKNVNEGRMLSQTAIKLLPLDYAV